MKVGYQILADLQQQQAFKQWGNSWSGYTGVFNWYFPISPSQVYAACLTKHTKNISSSHNWEPARVEEWNNSYARIHPDGDLGYSVIAICKAQQQWGFKEHNNTHQSTVKLPIAFKKGGYVGAANDSGTVTIGIKPTDKQTIELRDNNGGGKTGIYWFVVGQ